MAKKTRHWLISGCGVDGRSSWKYQWYLFGRQECSKSTSPTAIEWEGARHRQRSDLSDKPGPSLILVTSSTNPSHNRNLSWPVSATRNLHGIDTHSLGDLLHLQYIHHGQVTKRLQLPQRCRAGSHFAPVRPHATSRFH